MARTRSVKAHGKVLDAAIELFVEGGIDATSMDAIAGRSGVSKATIYKHWADKDALALEALSHLFGFYEEAPRFESGDLQQDFVDALTYQPAVAKQELKMQMMPHVMGYAARNRKFGDQWRSRMIDPPQTRLKNLIKRGMKQRELVSNIDLTIGIALLMGPAFYWYIVIGKKNSLAALPRSMAAEVVRAFFRAYSRTR
ncbi:MAG TPA: helix-turn-helix domain-containing protein [Terriglobales bacterium]|jgi:AcrR family transcriptional regulator